MALPNRKGFKVIALNELVYLEYGAKGAGQVKKAKAGKWWNMMIEMQNRHADEMEKLLVESGIDKLLVIPDKKAKE